MLTITGLHHVSLPAEDVVHSSGLARIRPTTDEPVAARRLSATARHAAKPLSGPWHRQR